MPVRRELRLRHPRAARPSLGARGARPAVGEGSAAGGSPGWVQPCRSPPPPADIIFEPLERWPPLKGRCRLVPGVPARGEAAARGKPEVAAGWRVPGRAGAEAPRRRLAEVRPRQCEGFPPSPRRARAGGDSPAAARGAGAGAELPRRREPPWEDERERKAKILKEQEVGGSIGC